MNSRCTAGRKKLEDLLLFLSDRKREDFSKKLFAFRSNQFNIRRKSIRERYTRQAQIFREYEALTEDQQLENILQYCFDMATCS